MHTELGNGNKRIIYRNVDRSREVDALLERFIKGWKVRLETGYKNIVLVQNCCKIILTSEDIGIQNFDVAIGITDRRCGLFAHNAMGRQLALRCREKGYAPVIECCEPDRSLTMTIGIDNEQNNMEQYVEIKDILFDLPMWV